MRYSVPVNRCFVPGRILLMLAAAVHAQSLPAKGPAGSPATSTGPATATNPDLLPVVDPAADGAAPEAAYGVRCLLSIDQIQAAIQDGPAGGLLLDLSGVTKLLDGTAVRPADLYGTASIGPYGFEEPAVTYTAKRVGMPTKIEAGKALLPVARLLQPAANSRKWTDRGLIVVRLELYLARPGQDRPLGTYDTFTAFRKIDDGFVRLPCLLEGPFINRLSSDDPTAVVISFVTSRPVQAKVVVDKQTFGEPAPAVRHEIELTGLKVGQQCKYRVDLGESATPEYTFTAAPPRGEGGAVFAFIGGSAASTTGPGQTPGLNADALDRMLRQAQRLSARFVIAGGDLVAGRTSEAEDLRTQLNAWKQTAAGYAHSRPIYTLMGAGESLLRAYRRDAGTVLLDRWPYAAASGEAVFAQTFVNFSNGPIASDASRPSYSRNVYSFQYGPALIVCLNNSYWYSSDPKVTGGCPDGYIFDDQMMWLRQQLAAAEEDAAVKYVVVFLSQPVLPNGGRLAGGMWGGGDNSLRPYRVDPRSGRPVPAGRGLLDMRNELLRAADAPRKLAAIVGSGEIAYHRTLVGNQVPVGDPARDDKADTGRMGAEPSPLTDLIHPTWLLVSGGGAALPDAEQVTPWNTFWRFVEKIDTSTPPEKRRYRYVPQETFLLFAATADLISLVVYTPNGDVIERIPDLLKYKREFPRSHCCTD
jgi:hypothetical protein